MAFLLSAVHFRLYPPHHEPFGQFVDPVTGANTQSIEGSWYAAKRKLKHGHDTSRQLLPGYLIEYMCRRKYAKEVLAFSTFVRNISYVYKV